MELFGKKPVVEVRINRKGPFRFFLDTGAGGTVLDQDLADELKLTANGTIKIGDPADPQGITANRNHIDTLEIGGAVFSDLIAVSFDRAKLYPTGAPRGVLGMPLFRTLLLRVDYPGSAVVIANGQLPAANGTDVIDYQPTEAGLFGIPIRVGTSDMLATLDTGSQARLSFPSDYVDKLSLAAKPVEVGRGRTVGGEAIIYGATLKDTVRFATYSFDNMNITFFDRLRHPNIGYAFVSQFAITIDQQNRRMRFEKPIAAAAAVGEPNPQKEGKFAEYAGPYGERRLTADGNDLYLQRLTGPMGEGPRVKLFEISKDAFGITGMSDVHVKFVRDPSGHITEVQVLTQAGGWETSKRERP